jgi:hypothetical protein
MAIESFTQFFMTMASVGRYKLDYEKIIPPVVKARIESKTLHISQVY